MRLGNLQKIFTDPEVAKKRLKGLGWELGNGAVVTILVFLANNLNIFNIPAWAILPLTLGLNQITKQLNSK